MKLPNNGGDTTDHILSSNQAFSTRIGLPLINLSKWREFHGNSQITQAVAKTTGCSSETDFKAPLLKTVPTQLMEHEEVKLVYT